MESDEPKQNNVHSAKDFVHLMSVNQINIYAYIMSIVGNVNDADDVMQNTSAYMWERFSDFKNGTDFVAWGVSIAYYKIKEFRKSRNRHQFSDEVLEIIHEKSKKEMADVNIYTEKLNQCLSKLSHDDLTLIRLRYESGNSVKRISLRVNKTVQTVYLKLSKIHGMLSRCIKRLIIQESI